MIRDQIDPKMIDEVFEEMKTWVAKKLKQKGYGSLVSRKEIIGHLEEEILEAKIESHARNDRLLENELFDIGCSAIWGICSLPMIGKK